MKWKWKEWDNSKAYKEFVDKMVKTILKQVPEWLEKKKRDAKVASDKLILPEKQKQDVGMIDLPKEIIKSDKSEIVISANLEGKYATEETIQEDEMLNKLARQYVGTTIADQNKLVAIHFANMNNIMIIHIPKNKQLIVPIHILKKAKKNGFHYTLIIAEEGSTGTIIEEETSNIDAEYMSTIVEIIVKPNAHVTYTCFQNYGKRAIHYIYKNAIVLRDGKMDWIEAYFGAAYSNSTVQTNLREDGAQTTNTTIFFGEQTQKFDIKSQTNQEGKHTFADMTAIGVVKDNAKAMCNGLIKIGEQSYGSQGHQKAKILLMNRGAQANAIPSMKINNFDVHATHEVSVGQIDKEKLFYIMSRGLNKKEAQKTMIEGFFVPIIEIIKSETAKKKLYFSVQNKLV